MTLMILKLWEKFNSKMLKNQIRDRLSWKVQKILDLVGKQHNIYYLLLFPYQKLSSKPYERKESMTAYEFQRKREKNSISFSYVNTAASNISQFHFMSSNIERDDKRSHDLKLFVNTALNISPLLELYSLWDQIKVIKFHFISAVHHDSN